MTGGARGITALCLLRMAQRAKLTFFILGRTALSSRAAKLAEFGQREWDEEKRRIVDRLQRAGTKPTPVQVERELSILKSEAEVHRSIGDLKAAGSEVLYRSVDVRDAQAVDSAISDAVDLVRSVDVVIHAAGIDVSRALRSKSLDQIETVVSVKLDGMRNVLNALQKHGLPPRRVVGFGSVSGRFGNLAQVDYSAANDGLAHMLRKAARDLEAMVSIIDWAPWSEVGMAARGSVQQTLEAAGIDFIPPEVGARLLITELSRKSGPTEVLAAGKLGPFTADAFGEAITAEKTTERRAETTSDIPSSATLLAGQDAIVEELVPGERLRARVYLNPKHPLLDHHRIERAAVFPGVGGMEVMRSAAAIVDPLCANSDFSGTVFHSPVKAFKDDPFEIEVQVARVADSPEASPVYHCRIVSWFRDKTGRRVGAERLHHECNVTPAPRRTPQTLTQEVWDDSIWIGHREIYKDFFHGPAFYFLDHLRVHADGRGVRFQFRDTEQRESMFADGPRGD